MNTQTYAIRNSLIHGRVRAPSSGQAPSQRFAPFFDALAQATQADLLWALEQLIHSDDKGLRYRTKRINAIDGRLREINLPNTAKGDAPMIDKILVTLKDDLSAVSFTVNGQVVDPRVVLTGLSKGQLRITHEERWVEPPTGPMRRYLKSQTWEVVPAQEVE